MEQLDAVPARRHALVLPKIPEPLGGKLGISHGVLDVLVPKVVLQRACIDALIRQLEAAGMTVLRTVSISNATAVARRFLPAGSGSVRIENFLIGGDGLADGVQLGACWLIGIFRRRQAAELQQAGHQQESSLVRGEICGGDLEVRRAGKAHGRAPRPAMATGMPLNAALSISLLRARGQLPLGRVAKLSTRQARPNFQPAICQPLSQANPKRTPGQFRASGRGPFQGSWSPLL